MPDGQNTATPDVPAKEESSGFKFWYTWHEGSSANKVIHSGTRIGDTVVPWSVAFAIGYATFSAYKNRRIKQDIREYKLDLKEYKEYFSIIEESEKENPGLQTQSIMFRKEMPELIRPDGDYRSKRQVKAWIADWLNEHAAFKPESLIESRVTASNLPFDDTQLNWYRVRRFDPELCDQESFVIFDDWPMGEDIKLVRCKLR